MPRSPTIRQLDVQVLISDRTRHGSRLWSEHGLALVIRCTYDNGRLITILFDTGASSPLLRHNLASVGLSPGEIDDVFLSHCHHDHTGGLPALLHDSSATFNLIAHPEITRRAVSLRGSLKPVGPDPAMWEEIPENRMMLLREPVEIHPGVWSSGSIPRRTDFEEPRRKMFTLRDGRLVPDDDPDDMALWFQLADGSLVLLTGCGHSGIANTVRHAADVMETDRFRAVIGGFHLIGADDERIGHTNEEMEQLNICELITGHCTGPKAERVFAQNMGDRHSYFHTGDQYTFGK